MSKSTNFWQSLPTPFFALAPMADVTDAAFRRVIAKYGKPDVMWTEFVSADGLYHTRELQKVPDAENPLMKDLVYGEGERPIVAQVFTSKPEMMEYVAALVVDLGFEGIDINMGCPDRSIEKQQAGAALMKNPALARELVRAAKRGTQGKIPVSVKTRVGFNKLEHVPPFGTWLSEMLAEEPAALTVHARTRKELSKVPARWSHVREAVELRDRVGSSTRIIGNGDLRDLTDARTKVAETGADGAMLGRAIFGNPWLFSTHTPTREEKLRVLVEHCRAFEELCGHKSFAVMKKHFKAYVRDFDGAAELREVLYATSGAPEVAASIEQFLRTVPAHSSSSTSSQGKGNAV
jgi:nifR3 family TIM-barrel protein